ncbi:MAG TPA: VWA domain-containing protein [Bryobacteraceae bacterium]|nr:VWA domain-containing protein [Bryobacteraceae bacterium]
MALCIASAQPPSIAPGEIKVRSSVYRPRSQFTIKVDTNLVEVETVVRDSRGRPVAGLERKDFEITDAGKKREITAFTVRTFTPAPVATNAHANSATGAAAVPAATPQSRRSVALVFDDVSMSGPELHQAKVGARRFLNEGLDQNDQVGVFSISTGQVAAFSTDTAKLLAAIDKLNSRPRAPEGGLCPVLTAYDAYLIANNLDPSSTEIKAAEAMRCAGDQPRGRPGSPGAIPERFVSQVKGQAANIWEFTRMISMNTLSSLQQIVDHMGRLPGRRTILLASSGFLAGTLEREQENIIRRAVHAGVVINALDAKGLFADPVVQPSRGADVQSIIRTQSLGSKALQVSNDALGSLSESTGGLFFRNRNDLDRGFQELGMVPEVSYLLGFSPPEPPNGKFHPLKVRLASGNKGTVQARQGYFSVFEKETPPEPERPIDLAAASTELKNDVAVDITSRVGRTETGEVVVQAIFHVDVGKVGRNVKLRVLAALYDAENFVTGKEGEIELALKDATYQLLMEPGMNATLSMPIASGSYRLRAVAENVADGKLKSANETVVVP